MQPWCDGLGSRRRRNKVSKLSHLDRINLREIGGARCRRETRREETMKTNLRYVGKQLGIVLLLAVIGIIILQLVWSVFGYGVIGDGKNPWSNLSDTWSNYWKATGK